MDGHTITRAAGTEPGASALSLLAAAVAGLWTIAALGTFVGALPAPPGGAAPLLFAPFGAAAALLAVRRPLPRAVRLAALWSVVVGSALISSFAIAALPAIALVPPVVAASAIACHRFPAAAVVGVLILTGTFNTLAAFTPIPVGESVDLLLAGLWAGTAWTLLLGRRERTPWVWTGLVLSVLYLVLTVGALLGSDQLFAGLYSFRVSAWYMATFLLIGYAGWPAATYRRIAHGALVLAAAVGGYATLRWITGPTDAESQLALGFNPTYNFINGELRAFGSFPTGHHLAAWTSIAVPFCFAYGLAGRGRWRIVAFAGAGLCAIGLFASEVRVGGVAALAGVILVMALFAFSRGPGGLRLGTAAAGAAAAVAILAVAFSLSAGSSDAGAERYARIITAPTEDPSYKARVFKWESALEDIRAHPLGQGLGSAGEAHQRYGRFVTVASLDIDNSYLKVAFDQGFAVMVLFIATIVMLLVGLARRTVASTRSDATAAGLGAVGALAAFSVLLPVGTYMEGLPALFAWTLVGLGVAGFAYTGFGRGDQRTRS